MMRHVSRTDRVALDCLFDRMNLEPKQNPNQICLHKKTTCWHFYQKKFLDRWVESPSVFIQHHVFFGHILAQAISKVLSLKSESALWLVPFRNEDKTLTRVMAKARPSNLAMHGQYKESVSSQGSGSPVNTGNEYNRTRISLAIGNCGSSSSNAEVGSSQVYRHPSLRETWTDRLNPTKEWRGRCQHRATCSSITRNGEHDILQISIRVKSSNNFYARSGFVQEQRIGVGIVHDIVDEGSQPPWAKFPR